MQGADILAPLDSPLALLRMRISKGACTAALLAYINGTLFAQGQSRNKPYRTLVEACFLHYTVVFNWSTSFLPNDDHYVTAAIGRL